MNANTHIERLGSLMAMAQMATASRSWVVRSHARRRPNPAKPGGTKRSIMGAQNILHE